MHNTLPKPPQSPQNRRKLYFYLLAPLAILLLSFFLFHSSHSHKINENKLVKDQASKAAIKKNLSNSNSEAKKKIKPVVEVTNDLTIDSYLKKVNFNGTALVVKDGKVVIDKGYGYRDFQKNELNNSQTVFYIGSISKVFVSTAILQIQEQKKLNIYDTVDKYIPGFPNGNRITLYQLLTHTSGLTEHSETNEKISHDELIKKIEKVHLKFQPGTGWYYSDSNYTILAYIVEKVSKDSLENYVQKHIFNVAHMDNSGFGDKYYQQTYQSKGYVKKNNTMISPSLPDMSQLFGCGDIYSTPYDLYLFDKSLYNGKLLSKASLKQMFKPNKHNYALGLYHDPGSYSDHGVLPGWNVLNSFGLSGDKYVVLFSNIQNGVKSLGVLNNQIFGLLNKVK